MTPCAGCADRDWRISVLEHLVIRANAQTRRAEDQLVVLRDLYRQELGQAQRPRAPERPPPTTCTRCGIAGSDHRPLVHVECARGDGETDRGVRCDAHTERGEGS